LPAYIERLRKTGRQAAAAELEKRHPAPPARRQSLNYAVPRSAQRFWDNDMHQNKDLKRVA